MGEKFRILKTPAYVAERGGGGPRVGEIWELHRGATYGLLGDDERAFGEKHIAVSHGAGTPFFTVPVSHVEEIEEQTNA